MFVADQYAIAMGNLYLVFAIEYAVKAALILGAGLLISFALRNRSASLRHTVLLMSIAAAFALPFVNGPRSLLSAIHPPESVRSAALVVSHSHSAVPPSGLQSRQSVHPTSRSLNFALVVGLLWDVGALAALIRLAWIVGVGVVYVRRCTRITDGPSLDRLQSIAKEIGLTRCPALKYSNSAAVPMTIGLVGPVIILPEASQEWSSEVVSAALAHEASHIRRRDWMWQQFAGLACVPFWFNPLFWVAARQLRSLCEQAADDAVLNNGMSPAAYADSLLAIARQLSIESSIPASAVAMTRSSEIKRRILSILDTNKARAAAGRVAKVGMVVVSLLMVAALTGFSTSADQRSESAAIAQAYSIVSVSNMKQLGLIAAMLYPDQNGGRMPDASHWVDALSTTKSEGPDPIDIQGILKDPSAPGVACPYAFNRNLSGVKLSTVSNPENLVMLFESTSGVRNANDTGESVPVPGRHGGWTAYGFADGRVRWVRDGDKPNFVPVFKTETAR